MVQARGGLSYTPGLGRYVDDAESTTDSATTNLTNDHHSLNYARKAIRQMTLPFARSLRMSKHTHTHTHTTVLLLFWNMSGTTRVSRYQKGKTRQVKNQSGFTGARDSEWQWHLLGYMQSLQLIPGNHANIPPLSFLQAGWPS